MYAIYIDRSDIVDFLLKQNKIDIYLKDKLGMAAIDIAIERNNKVLVSELCKKGAIPGVNQTGIFYNLRLFVDKHKENKDKNFTEKLKMASGHCNGLSKVWLYSKWASDNARKIYNNEWFRSTIANIVRWDGESNLDSITVEQFDQFLSALTLFQDPQSYYGSMIPYSDFKSLLKKSLLYVENKELIEEYTLVLDLTQDQLEIVLNTIVRDKKLIVINIPKHTVALYKNNGKFYYYDPNALQGEIEFSSIEEVTEKIFESHYLTTDKFQSVLPLRVFIYDFIDPARNDNSRNYGIYYQQAWNDILNIKPKIGVNTNILVDAAEMGCFDSVKFCLQNNVDINSTNASKSTSLIAASMHGKVRMVEYLLKNGASPDVINDFDMTALMLASYRDFPLVVKTLLYYGADPNKQNKYGETAIMYACDKGFVDVVEQLLSIKKIKLDIKNNDNKDSAITIAAQNNHAEIIRKLANKDSTLVNLKHQGNKTPLMVASVMGHIDTIKALIENKALVDLQYEDGSSALILALYNKHPDAAIKLLRSGSNPDLARFDGVTPLMLAAANGYEDVVYELLEKRYADCSLKDKDGKDAIKYAKDSRHDVIATRIRGNCSKNNKREL